MVNARNHALAGAGGFTLIEFAITIVVMALLVLAAMPFTREWIDSNRQLQARSQLWEAVGQARALALRNRHALSGEVVRVDYDADTHLLYVRMKNADGTWPNVGESPQWQSGQLAEALVVKPVGTSDFTDLSAFNEAEDVFTCAGFDTRGQIVDIGCSLPTGARRVAIGIRNQDPLYVELL